MFEKILLPLDGSELAETAIPYVRDLASQLNAEVYLLHVCPEGHQNLNRMHKIYLDHTADNLSKEISTVLGPNQKAVIKSDVVSGEPAKAIFDYIQQNSISLVAITTCGASGIRAWTMGNVADKVVRGAGIPTLLVRVGESPRETGKGFIKQILAPLDTSEASRISIPYAVDLAKRLNAHVTLFSMAQTVYAQNLDGMGVGVGVNWDAVDKATEKYTNDLLKSIEDDIQSKGVSVSHITALGIDAASEILELENKLPVDLIMMATRGRSKIARWAFGSVAEKVLREGGAPLLVIRQPST